MPTPPLSDDMCQEAEGPTAMRCFPELEEAVEFLKFKRKGL